MRTWNPPYLFAGQRTGRPRERWYVGDYPQRIEANALRRDLLARGVDLASVRLVTFRHGDGEGARTDSAALRPALCPVYGVQLWLLCPRCGSRRAHLYHVRSGLACRRCLGIGYAVSTKISAP